MAVADGLGASPDPVRAESPGVGATPWLAPSPDPDRGPPGVPEDDEDGEDDEEDEPPSDREESGSREPDSAVPDFEGEEWRPVTASLIVVPLPPLKLLPDTSSYPVMPAMVTPKTTAAASTGRRQLFTRAR